MTAAKKESATPIQDSRERLQADFWRALKRHSKRLNELGHTCDGYEYSAAIEALRVENASKSFMNAVDKQLVKEFEAYDELTTNHAVQQLQAIRDIAEEYKAEYKHNGTRRKK